MPLQVTEESAQLAMRKPDAAPSDPEGKRNLSMANAARQVVLRRVAPALRHDMVVNLQALSMLAEMLNARAERATLSREDLQQNLSKLNRLSRQSVAKCLEVVSWMEVSDEQSIALHEGVAEVVNLLTASFNFRGFGLVNEVGPAEFEVTRHTTRSLLTALLLVLADEADVPSDLVLEARTQGPDAWIRIRRRAREMRPGADLPPASHAAPRPRVEWDEIDALAHAESAEVERDEDGVTLRLARAVVTSPLQMAPV